MQRFKTNYKSAKAKMVSFDFTCLLWTRKIKNSTHMTFLKMQCFNQFNGNYKILTVKILLTFHE